MKEDGFNCPLSLFLHIRINKILKESWLICIEDYI